VQLGFYQSGIFAGALGASAIVERTMLLLGRVQAHFEVRPFQSICFGLQSDSGRRDLRAQSKPFQGGVPGISGKPVLHMPACSVAAPLFRTPCVSLTQSGGAATCTSRDRTGDLITAIGTHTLQERTFASLGGSCGKRGRRCRARGAAP